MTTNAIDPRRVEYKPISELIPDPRNPKAHDEQTIDDSIGRFGVLDLIVQDQRTGYIVSGHGRRKALAAMQERGENPPEGIKVDDDGTWLVPVVTGWASRTDAEAGAALIAMNRTTELGGWVDDDLLSLLEELDDAGTGFEGVGFSGSDIDDLRAELEEREASVQSDLEDAVEGVGQVTPITQLTEQYRSRGRRVMVLDYSLEEFADMTSRLAQIRKDLGVDNNSDALRMLVEQACPEVPDILTGDTDEGWISEDESRDPAATI